MLSNTIRLLGSVEWHAALYIASAVQSLTVAVRRQLIIDSDRFILA